MPKTSKLTQERNLARAAREISRIKADGFTRREQARAEFGRATKKNIQKVESERRKVAQGKPIDTETSRRILAGRKKLEAKADKGVLSQKRLAHEIEVSGIMSVDIAEKIDQDPKDVYKSIQKARRGELKPHETTELRRGFELAQEKNLYYIIDDSGQFPPCPVFPNVTQARKAGYSRQIGRPFMTVDQAYEWWKTIAAGAAYFCIVHNKDQFEIWDSRSSREEKKRKRSGTKKSSKK